MRYTGQAYQITLDFTAEELAESGGILSLTRRFDAEHKRLFTFDLGEGHEIVMIRAIVRVKSERPWPNWIPAAHGDPAGRLQDSHDSRYYYEGAVA